MVFLKKQGKIYKNNNKADFEGVKSSFKQQKKVEFFS